jgi:hypothetical protein
MLNRLGVLLAMFLAVANGLADRSTRADDPPNRDAVLDWNAVALAVNVHDHSGTFGPAEQGGPTRSSRALAIVHAAMYDAYNSIRPVGTRYLTRLNGSGASIDAAVASAANRTLRALYPSQAASIQQQYVAYLAAIPGDSSKALGIQIGNRVAQRLLDARANDGSGIDVPYIPTGEIGDHNVDPNNPLQGFLTPGWGSVPPFGLSADFDFVSPPPPVLDSGEYAAAFNDVKLYGGDGISTPTIRTRRQTETGLFWAYDGSRGIGVPPRLYNQIVRVIADRRRNTEAQNARLFALVNLAMADAGIVCWETKYEFRLWRPILGIRNGDVDSNDGTDADPNWSPLGAPASNQSGNNFTPPFPAYTSGHATFGAAMFGIVARFYGRDDIRFTMVSDELNGVTTDNLGIVRPLRPRHYTSLRAAAEENARSRIYLGIHWQFDADEGVACGDAIAEDLFQHILLPLN